MKLCIRLFVLSTLMLLVGVPADAWALNARAFVTSGIYNGDLEQEAKDNFAQCSAVTTGIEGADCICQATADAAALGGVWRAWICTNASSMTARPFSPTDVPYILMDGSDTQISADWAALLGVPHDSALDYDETGAPISGYTWTGCDDSGATTQWLDCDDWDGGGANGTRGLATSATDTWTSNGSVPCTATYRLYCFEQDPTPPTVTTQAVTGIGTTTATGNGNITDLGATNPTQHGVCWNTTGTPTTADSKTEEGAASATGAFTSNMTGLSPNTTYYVRAYATNTAGTAYGGQVSFNSLGTLPTGTPSSYMVTVTKVEMWNLTSWVTIFSGTAQLDVKAGGTFPGIGDLSLPAGTYSQVRVTFNNSFPVAGTLSYGGTAYYTTATTFGGQTNLASTPTTVAESMAEFTFRIEAWGAINTEVPQTFAITPITVGPLTDYQPTVRVTISDKLELKGTAGTPSTYYFALSAPTVNIVEP